LIGREHERARLRALINATHSTGIGRVAVVIGDAGIGKSRLLGDLEIDARGAGFRWTVVENVSYGTGEPYRFARAFAQAIADEQGTDSGTYARALLFTEDMPAAEARRLAGAVAAIAREASFSGWEEEAALAPTKPADVRAGVLHVALRYTRRLAETLGPRIVVIDDLHWADHSSLPIIELLVQTAPSMPFVFLLGSRTGALPAWLDKDDIERIVLGGLDQAEAARDPGRPRQAPRRARVRPTAGHAARVARSAHRRASRSGSGHHRCGVGHRRPVRASNGRGSQSTASPRACREAAPRLGPDRGHGRSECAPLRARPHP
jgi:hypothetical protein